MDGLPFWSQIFFSNPTNCNILISSLSDKKSLIVSAVIQTCQHLPIHLREKYMNMVSHQAPTMIFSNQHLPFPRSLLDVFLHLCPWEYLKWIRIAKFYEIMSKILEIHKHLEHLHQYYWISWILEFSYQFIFKIFRTLLVAKKTDKFLNKFFKVKTKVILPIYFLVKAV